MHSNCKITMLTLELFDPALVVEFGTSFRLFLILTEEACATISGESRFRKLDVIWCFCCVWLLNCLYALFLALFLSETFELQFSAFAPTSQPDCIILSLPGFSSSAELEIYAGLAGARR